MTWHGQPYANTEAAPLQVIFKLALTLELPVPAASGAPVSISGNNQNSPIAMPTAEIIPPRRASRGKNPPPSDATNPTSIAKTP